ncbi:YifB family Mg chelatase-like AAA ATPase [Salinisphaera orenii]|uniref:YifB family Mg chelatase-like AAA ATPase n=1 Tax=Salinisphaera orenii TaxID=856731 RepID=UPI000DBE021C
MALATVYSRAQNALQAESVGVEVDLASGLPALTVVGLPEAEVKESKDRVRAAITNSGYEFPTRRITVNLAPADLPKEGGRFDLAIALGILCASGQVAASGGRRFEFLGEVSLSGELRSVRGVLPAALAASAAGRGLIVPTDNGPEAALADATGVASAEHLHDVVAALNADEPTAMLTRPEPVTVGAVGGKVPDLADVRGQAQAKRALEIAAAGGHSMLMVGPPGAGKSMLAARLPGLLPPMSRSEALEVASIASISGAGFDPATWGQRPFRDPHHTASGVALVGGGSSPRPGEITRAHRGCLFLDELPEFDRRVLEVLREPLESGEITISRAARQTRYPATFQLIAAMNPCPCGYLGDPSGRCHCTPDQVSRYRRRLSGPLMDRVDMYLSVAAVPRESLVGEDDTVAEASAAVLERVETARMSATRRGTTNNAALDAATVDAVCRPADDARQLLNRAIQTLNLSARGYHRILRLARTIADLAGAETIGANHVAEAVGYRQMDRQ